MSRSLWLPHSRGIVTRGHQGRRNRDLERVRDPPQSRDQLAIVPIVHHLKSGADGGTSANLHWWSFGTGSKDFTCPGSEATQGIAMSSVKWVTLMFWTAIVVDAVAALALASPGGSIVRQLAYPGVDPSQVAYADGTRSAFPLMLGWTLLLVWGVRRPVERRMLLLLTLPVVVGFVAVELVDVYLGHAILSGTLPTLVLQAALVAGLITAYRAADQAATSVVVPLQTR